MVHLSSSLPLSPRKLPTLSPGQSDLRFGQAEQGRSDVGDADRTTSARPASSAETSAETGRVQADATTRATEPEQPDSTLEESVANFLERAITRLVQWVKNFFNGIFGKKTDATEQSSSTASSRSLGADKRVLKEPNATHEQSKVIIPASSRLAQAAVLEKESLPTAEAVIQGLESKVTSHVILKADDPVMMEAILYHAFSRSVEKNSNKKWYTPDAPEALLEDGLTKSIAELRAQNQLKPDTPIVLVLKNLDYTRVQALLNQQQTLQNLDPNLQLILAVDNDHYQETEPNVMNPSPFPHVYTLEGRVAQSFKTIDAPKLGALDAWKKVLTFGQDYSEILKENNLIVPKAEDFDAFVTTLTRSGVKTYPQMIAVIEALAGIISKKVDHQPVSLTTEFFEQNAVVIREITAQVLRDFLPAQSDEFFETLDPSQFHHTFDDITGMEKAKKTLRTVLKEAKYPNVYQHYYDQNPRILQNSLLLFGPKGNGKSMMMGALANEASKAFGADVTVLSGTGSMFRDKYLGEGAARVRKLGKMIEDAPGRIVIVNIDEADSVGKRTDVEQGSDNENNATVNQILTLMQGIKVPNKRVIYLFNTNKPQNMDEAFLDRVRYKVKVDNPTRAERRAQLERHLKNSIIDIQTEDMENLWTHILNATEGFNGRSLDSVIMNLTESLRAQVPDEEMNMLENDPRKLAQHRLSISAQDFVQAFKDYKEEDELALQGDKDSGGYKLENPGFAAPLKLTA